jgi:hypothetical protein
MTTIVFSGRWSIDAERADIVNFHRRLLLSVVQDEANTKTIADLKAEIARLEKEVCICLRFKS